MEEKKKVAKAKNTKVKETKAIKKTASAKKTTKKTTTAKVQTATKKTKKSLTETKAKVNPIKQEPYFPERIDKEELKNLPRAVCTGEVRLVDNKVKLRKALKELEGVEVVGIDTETRPAFTKRQQHSVCLLQIATSEVTYLFRLNKLGFTEGLIKLLSNPDIIKVGLSLQDDCRALRKLEKFEPKSFLELQRFCLGYGIRDASLQKIYAIVFGQYMSKSQRMTNWEATELTQAQQEYAALDAIACLQIYNKLLTFPNPNPALFALIYD